MASLDELKRTFFDECGELLQEMETGLTDLQDGTGSEDTVHAVFRAVHSIKGGAGIFGFERLVEFAHVFETVLDSVRHGTLHQTPEVFTVLLMSSDMLADLVSMSRSGEAIPAGHSGECRQALRGKRLPNRFHDGYRVVECRRMAGNDQLAGLVHDRRRLTRPVRELHPPGFVRTGWELGPSPAAQLFQKAGLISLRN